MCIRLYTEVYCRPYEDFVLYVITDNFSVECFFSALLISTFFVAVLTFLLLIDVNGETFEKKQFVVSRVSITCHVPFLKKVPRWQNLSLTGKGLVTGVFSMSEWLGKFRLKFFFFLCKFYSSSILER